jgi:hypothetical protein
VNKILTQAGTTEVNLGPLLILIGAGDDRD